MDAKRFLIKMAMVFLITAAAQDRLGRTQTIDFISVPEGYRPGSVDLPRPFGGALSINPIFTETVYASVGDFGDMNLARIDLRNGAVTIVAEGPFGALAGIAVVSNSFVVLIDNATPQSGDLAGETIYAAKDGNRDGDFNDPGEIFELIAPILVDSTFGGFSGAQARRVPLGLPSGLPETAIMFQTADGGGNAELLVVEGIFGPARYRPAAMPYFTGFDFNGGFDFDSQGRVLMGTLNGTTFAGEVFALVNVNGDENIDAGESKMIVGGEGGMSDLVIDREDDVFFTGSESDFTASVRTFRVPEDPLNATATTATFATTDSSFLSAVLINSKIEKFEPFQGTAIMLIGGFDGSSPGAGANLLTLRPLLPNAAEHWRGYE